jgi:3'-phosphoadenosine 5'-phosphosulfate (PAPS) 3'-phosphatase
MHHERDSYRNMHMETAFVNSSGVDIVPVATMSVDFYPRLRSNYAASTDSWTT